VIPCLNFFIVLFLKISKEVMNDDWADNMETRAAIEEHEQLYVKLGLFDFV